MLFTIFINNIYMNQILRYVKNNTNKKRKFLFFLFLMITVLIIIIIVDYKKENDLKENEYKISKTMNQKELINNVYKIENEEEYFGRIIIDKINLNELIYNIYSEELLKFYICKLSDENDYDKISNLVLVGHNYNNDMFFSKINKLDINDVIKIEKDDKAYIYQIYKKYEVDENDMEPTNISNIKEITLITCNNFNKKRIIIKGRKIINDEGR